MAKEDDLVMCTVKSLEGTTVFVHIEGDGEGSIALSEIAAGRIRNLREYVVPNKKIVCKVLKIVNNQAQLSLRRVTGTERQEIEERYRKEKSFMSILKTISKEPDKMADKIKISKPLWEFFDEAKENPKIIYEILKKDEAQQLEKILSEKKDKEKEVKKIIIIKSDSDSGVNDIKQILNVKGIDIRYLGSSQFVLIAKGKEFKDADAKIQTALKEIEKQAKEKKAILEIKEK
jgi:translation initiation factor 2 alpha subunit (eIF-2alpha)